LAKIQCSNRVGLNGTVLHFQNKKKKEFHLIYHHSDGFQTEFHELLGMFHVSLFYTSNAKIYFYGDLVCGIHAAEDYNLLHTAESQLYNINETKE
jgi:hypothetical protein